MDDDLFELLTERGFTFQEALEFFGDKLTLQPEEFYKLADEYRYKAFTVSGYSKITVLKRFQDELLNAIDEGQTMQQFRSNMNDFLQRRGYEGITNFQADNIYRTNIQTAYQVGHYKQMTDPTVLRLRPYWQYDAVNDSRTRPSHLAMDGKVFRADDPIWDTWYPPNGFRCRCGVTTLSERQVRERGLMVETSAPVSAEVNGQFTNVIPDPHFSTNPAKEAFNPDVSKYPDTLRKAYETRQRSKSQN
ncbi:phage minor head protein [Paenibacillus sanguinis]|uniref:phage head morphogenesis protein n=1 Tax=Paenibacillus sanguinis TaxID=225906 RepID=UPI00036F439F|nr:phage minor head protein [Paenibacillus sanguinis]